MSSVPLCFLITVTLLIPLLVSCGGSPKNEPTPTTIKSFTITFRYTDPTDIEVVLRGPISTLQQSPEELLSFGVTKNDPMLGNYKRSDKELTFKPDFRLADGEEYVAAFRIDGKELVATHKTPAIKKTIPRLLGIYPSGNVVPANHLKFYLVFSEPMADGDAFDHLKLINVTRNKPVPDPFRRTELWSDDGKVFTLWLHPGRQKTGVNLNVDIGPILEPNEAFRLIVSPTWRSQLGENLAGKATKGFKAAGRINKIVDPKLWKTQSPQSGTREPLQVLFDRPLDWALLHSEFHVVTDKGERVSGKVKTARNERQWQFVPAENWPKGRLNLSVSPAVEDLAGNNLRRPFEVDVKASGQERDVKKRVLLPFSPIQARSASE